MGRADRRAAGVRWGDVRDDAIRQMLDKAERAGCRCLSIPQVVSPTGVYPVRLNHTHNEECPALPALKAAKAN